MSTGPENRFIRSINTKMPREVHCEKMHNPYRGGTADCWYSGPAGDAWVEYKWIPNVPRKGAVVPDLSELQKRWLRGRYSEGRRVFVIVGCPAGAVVFKDPNVWEEGFPAETFNRLTMPKAKLVGWLTSVTMGDQTDAGDTGKARRRGHARVQDTRDRAADLRADSVQTQEMEGEA